MDWKCFALYIYVTCSLNGEEPTIQPLLYFSVKEVVSLLAKLVRFGGLVRGWTERTLGDTMVLGYVGGLKSLLAGEEFCSESIIFKLCYRYTVAFLVGSSLFLTANEFFGKPIDCITDLDAGNVVNTYCWIKSTFTMNDYQYR